MNPRLIVVMGVSGCGKSTIAKAIAERFGYVFVEADDYHSETNRQHMASGQALTDQMREPWLQSLEQALGKNATQSKSSVLSFSGLRAAHRARIRDLPFDVMFVHLVGAKETIRERMESRTDHFMPSTLLDSQFSSLEPTDNEANTIHIDISGSLETVIAETLANLITD